MQENNKLINNIDNINTKIRKILENNLIANLIIIAIGFIASLAMSIYSYLNIAKLIDNVYSTTNFNIFFIDSFYFYIFYFFCFSLIFNISLI